VDFLTWRIGDVRVTRVVENTNSLPPKELLPEATSEAVARYDDWLRPHFVDDDGNLLLSIHALIVESAGRRILVDTCLGPHRAPGFEHLTPEVSTFLEDLAAAGFPPESIDTVLCTHLHFDHVGWNTQLVDGRFVPTFPRARYLFARVEWEHWRKEQVLDFAPTLEETVRPILDAGLADLVEMDHGLTDEVWLEATPGHTPGHVTVRIASGGEQALITGDMTHHPVQWAEPDWAMIADSDAKQAAETRHRVLQEHADRPTLVIGTHYAGPSAGHLERHASGIRFEALSR
jgi:glyoxylase-like metal-dependent hydrolase (beta-lactamase superfamily II)